MKMSSFSRTLRICILAMGLAACAGQMYSVPSTITISVQELN
jgi:hypothetical protein